MAKVRLSDIAQKAGVSAVSVHNALTGQRGVSDEMREQIIAIANEMGYKKKQAAAYPERYKTKQIGVLIHEKYLAEYLTFYWKMYQEMALAAQEKDCMLTVEIVYHKNEDMLEPPKILLEKNRDGVIVIGDMHADYLEMLKQVSSVPIVYLDFYKESLNGDAVISDNFYGMYLLTQYLFKQGIHKMAYVGSIHATSSIMDRYFGFMKALTENKETLPKEWLIEDRNENGDIHIELPEVMPEAFVCNCDLVAGKLILELQARGIRVPDDISVIGFDNYLYPGFPDLKITTYEVNMRKMSKVALDRVLKRIRGPLPDKHLEIVTGHIIEKESVKKKI